MNSSTLVSEQVYFNLRDEILYGQYFPGVHLVESELVEKYSTSRTTIREVLRRLTEDELVEQIPHKGVRVRTLSIKEVHDYYQIAKALEGIVARDVALNRTDEQLKELESILSKIKTAVDNENVVEHIKLIHHFRSTLASYTGNIPLTKLVSKTHRIIALYISKHYIKTSLAIAYENHVKLVDAIRKQDPIVARATMKALIQTSLDLY